jgi:cysteine desulfurase
MGIMRLVILLPLKEVSELCKKYDAIFHSDTVQTMGHYAFDLAIDAHYTLSMHLHTNSTDQREFGFIYVNKSIKANPDIIGGGQERGLRGGTENLYGIVGLAKPLEICYRDLPEHQVHVGDLKQYMAKELEMSIPGVSF